MRGELRSMSCPTTCEGLDGTPPLRSGVFVMRSIRGRLSDPRATLPSGVLQKSMRGRSQRALLSASMVMVSWSSLMSTRRASPGRASALDFASSRVASVLVLFGRVKSLFSGEKLSA